MFKKAVSCVLALLVALSAFSVAAFAAPAKATLGKVEKVEAVDIAHAKLSFLNFQRSKKDAAYPSAQAVVLAAGGERVTLNDGEAFTTNFVVEQEGLYALQITYKNIAGRGTMPIAKIAINGEYQFKEAESVKFKRQYKETNIGNRDTSGNEIVPENEEIFKDTTVFVKDIAGNYGGVLYFYLNAGVNAITFNMDNEAIELSEITFKQVPTIPTYNEVSSSFKHKEYSGETIYYEAENILTKSDTTILRANDWTSPTITPYDIKVKNLNVFGGTNFNTPGQFVEWEIVVPEDGLYALTFKARQNQNVGVSSFRSIYIDDKIPYSEFQEVAFQYDTQYQNVTLMAGDKPALIELSEGKHTIRMEAALGEYKTLLSDISDTAENLSTAYRRIIMLTTADPDSYRDYKIDENLPEVMEIFATEKENLERMYNTIMTEMSSASTGTKVLDTLATQLEDFIDDPYRMTSRLSNFKTNITSLTTWLQSATNQPLQLDSIALSAPEGEIKAANPTFWGALKHEFLSFISTFSDEYLNYTEDENSITVWLSTGQTQMNTIRALVESEYNPYHDTKVNVKLVTASLLMAIVSGKGPDIALGQDEASVMNYAFRDAVVDISRFDDLEETLTRFRPSTRIQVTFNDKMYGLPESQAFTVLYYRTDVLEELKLKAPNTWTEVISVMSALKKKNLEVGLPTTLYQTVLYQKGGQMYNDDLTATQITTLESIDAFNFVCSLFTDYSVPKAFDAANRFRTGEMPIVVADYAFCNQLALSAPEIQGKWRMALMPATEKEDGTLDRTITSTTTYSIILNEEKAEACWEFLKWWSSEEVNYKYATTIEQILGISSRSTTANVAVFNKLAWDPDDLAVINKQAETLVAIPAVPGNYFVSRHLSNAMNRVFFNSGVPAEELESYSQIIDDEIKRKRDELGFN